MDEARVKMLVQEVFLEDSAWKKKRITQIRIVQSEKSSKWRNAVNVIKFLHNDDALIV